MCILWSGLCRLNRCDDICVTLVTNPIFLCSSAIGDIDLFTGVVAELPLKVRPGFEGSTSTIGETLNFIQGTSFQRAKCGDRYWYEFADALFTPGKLFKSIRHFLKEKRYLVCSDVLLCGVVLFACSLMDMVHVIVRIVILPLFLYCSSNPSHSGRDICHYHLRKRSQCPGNSSQSFLGTRPVSISFLNTCKHMHGLSNCYCLR